MLSVSTIPKFTRRHPSDVQVNQAANGVITSFDALAEMLESIENFITRLSTYVEMPQSTPAFEKTVVKLMVGLISTLALVTRKLEKRRSRESFLANVLLYSAQRDAVKWVKNFFGVKDINKARQRLDRLQQEELLAVGAQILRAIDGE